MTGYNGISFGSAVAKIWQRVKTYRLLVLTKCLFMYLFISPLSFALSLIATGNGMDGKIFL
jgi:hypothetical protein